MKESPGILLSRKRVVQVAGVATTGEARMIASCGADFIGFPLGPGRDEGDVGERDAARIVRALRPPVYGVLITYAADADAIFALCRDICFPGVQLHGDVAPGEVSRLKELSPGLFVVKTLVVRGADSVRLLDEVERYGAHVDAFLADTFDDATGRWGATGKTHDWSVSRRIVECSRRPVLLAGGLTPGNVQRAIAEVAPAGVDAHTGVEDAAGRKDRRLVERFVENARKAFDSI